MTGKVRRLSYATATHCAKGHDLRVPGNLTVQHSGARCCAVCRRERDKAAKAKKAADIAAARVSGVPCRSCGKLFTPTWNTHHCSQKCLSATRSANAKRLAKNGPEYSLSAGEVDAILTRAVANEIAMPWERTSYASRKA